MKLEITKHDSFDEGWWFDIGISFFKVSYSRCYVLTFGFGFFSLYISWGK